MIPIIVDRQTFERIRFCPGCGRRIKHLQWRDSAENHIFEKKCPLWAQTPDRHEYHFWIVHKQPIMKRDKNGKLTHGARKALTH